MKLSKQQIVILVLVIVMCLSLAAPVATELIYPRLDEPKKDAEKSLKDIMHKAAPWSKLTFRLCVIAIAAMLVAPASKKRRTYSDMMSEMSNISNFV